MLDVLALRIAVSERSLRAPRHEFWRDAGVDVLFPNLRFGRLPFESDTAFENRVFVPLEYAWCLSEPPINVVRA